jgi:hypothetical protein
MPQFFSLFPVPCSLFPDFCKKSNDKTEVRSGLKGGEQILLSFPPGVRESSARRLFPGSSSDRSPSNSSPTPSR